MRLRDIYDGTRHATNQDHAARGIAIHQVLGDGGGEEVGAVDIDIPELAHAVNGVVDGLEVLREPSAGYEVVDLSVLLEDVVDAGLHGLRVGHISIVCGHLRNSHGAWVLSPEYVHKFNCLLLSLLLCAEVMLAFVSID